MDEDQDLTLSSKKKKEKREEDEERRRTEENGGVPSFEKGEADRPWLLLAGSLNSHRGRQRLHLIGVCSNRSWAGVLDWDTCLICYNGPIHFSLGY